MAQQFSFVGDGSPEDKIFLFVGKVIRIAQDEQPEEAVNKILELCSETLSQRNTSAPQLNLGFNNGTAVATVNGGSNGGLVSYPDNQFLGGDIQGVTSHDNDWISGSAPTNRTFGGSDPSQFRAVADQVDRSIGLTPTNGTFGVTVNSQSGGGHPRINEDWILGNSSKIGACGEAVTSEFGNGCTSKNVDGSSERFSGTGTSKETLSNIQQLEENVRENQRERNIQIQESSCTQLKKKARLDDYPVQIANRASGFVSSSNLVEQKKSSLEQRLVLPARRTGQSVPPLVIKRSSTNEYTVTQKQAEKRPFHVSTPASTNQSDGEPEAKVYRFGRFTLPQETSVVAVGEESEESSTEGSICTDGKAHAVAEEPKPMTSRNLVIITTQEPTIVFHRETDQDVSDSKHVPADVKYTDQLSFKCAGNTNLPNLHTSISNNSYNWNATGGNTYLPNLQPSPSNTSYNWNAIGGNTYLPNLHPSPSNRSYNWNATGGNTYLPNLHPGPSNKSYDWNATGGNTYLPNLHPVTEEAPQTEWEYKVRSWQLYNSSSNQQLATGCIRQEEPSSSTFGLVPQSQTESHSENHFDRRAHDELMDIDNEGTKNEDMLSVGKVVSDSIEIFGNFDPKL